MSSPLPSSTKSTRVSGEARANAVEAGLGDPIGDGSGDPGRHAFVYLKYHKPRGIVCTMEPSRADSLLFALKDELTALGRQVKDVKADVGALSKLMGIAMCMCGHTE